MKYIIFGIIILFIVILVILYNIHKKKAICKVNSISDTEKLIYINEALRPFGFAFDVNCDIVISQNDVWQRDVGFTDLYDLNAPFFNMVMDSEPIFFEYKGREYRLELWKGQYGITTGAEVGLYVHDFDCPKGFYRAAKDDESLKVKFVLTKKCDLFTRCSKSWWLTGFDIGVFSKPKNLKMNVCIEFPNCEMLNAFVKALIKTGYSYCQLNICEKTVCFCYCCPSQYKPNCKHRIIKCIAQIFNYINCSIYMCFTSCFNRTIDKLTYIRFMIPCLFNFIIRLSIPYKIPFIKHIIKKKRKDNLFPKF